MDGPRTPDSPQRLQRHQPRVDGDEETSIEPESEEPLFYGSSSSESEAAGNEGGVLSVALPGSPLTSIPSSSEAGEWERALERRNISPKAFQAYLDALDGTSEPTVCKTDCAGLNFLCQCGRQGQLQPDPSALAEYVIQCVLCHRWSHLACQVEVSLRSLTHLDELKFECPLCLRSEEGKGKLTCGGFSESGRRMART